MWPVDVLDIVRVLRDLGRPAHLIGHSKGGGQATDAATLEPDLVRGLVNLDGFGPPDDQGFKRPGAPDQSQMTIAQRCGEYLDRRRKADQRTVWPAYPSFEDLVARRGEQNPGLDSEWLRYFWLAAHGCRCRVQRDGSSRSGRGDPAAGQTHCLSRRLGPPRVRRSSPCSGRAAGRPQTQMAMACRVPTQRLYSVGVSDWSRSRAS
jgi:pimeloyl-ACP methyl ester carboxylesterase